MPRLGLGASLSGGAVSEEPFANTAYVTFDGSNDHISTTSKVELQAFTLNCWAKLAPSTAYEGICGCMGSDGFDGYRLGFSNIGAIHCTVGDTTSYIYLNSGTANMDNDTWRFLSTSYDGTTLKAYVAGEDDGGSMVVYNRSDTEMTITFDDNFHMGAWTDGISPFGGDVDEVSLYNKVLSSEEFATLYGDDGDPTNAGDPRTISGLVGYYRLEEGTGTSTADSSSTGNNGTLVNGVAWATH